ncbi:glycosyltransferase family 4 protein [Ferruginibacter sp.]
MIKVLHVAYSGLGGHGNVFFSMVDADETRHFEYEVIFFGVEDVRNLYIEKATEKNIPWYFVKKKPGIDIAAYKKIKDIIKKTKPDIIFLHSSAYIFPAKWATATTSKKMKIIVRETQANHLKTKQEWLGLSFALLFATKVVFLSNEYNDTIQKKLRFFYSHKRTKVIPNGIDFKIYHPTTSQENNSIVVGMQSRLIAIKDHKTLLKAFKIVLDKNITGKPMQLIIAGDGDCRQALETQAENEGIEKQVTFLGMLEEKALPAFINSLNIYVHATLGETMSTAIMQVMACKKPVVASDVLGVNNMIKDNETGLLIPPENAIAMADAILSLINNPGKASEISVRAYDFAQDNYSSKRMFQQYKTVFEE